MPTMSFKTHGAVKLALIAAAAASLAAGGWAADEIGDLSRAFASLHASAQEADRLRAEALREREWREIGLGAQILRDLGVTSIKLIATRERRYVGVEGFGIAIEGTEGVDA